MRDSTKRKVLESSDRLAPSAMPGLFSSAPRRVLPPHQVTVTGGKFRVYGVLRGGTCALLRAVLRSSHYMISTGEVQPVIGPAVRCDCGAVVHRAT